MRDNEVIHKKITDPELLEFSMSGKEGVRTILVEIGLNEPRVYFYPSSFAGDNEALTPQRVVSKKENKLADITTASIAEGLLKEIVNRPLKWLPAAHVFIVDANAKEILEMAKMKTVIGIKANSPLI